MALAAQSDLSPALCRRVSHGSGCGRHKQILGATTVGSIAARVFHEGAEGRIAAVFKQSFYVDHAGSWICVVRPGFGNGPINVVLEGSAGLAWPRDIKLGNSVRLDNTGLRIGDRFRVSIESARRWRPPPVPQSCPASRSQGLAALAAAVRGRIPRQGLGVFLTSLQPTDKAPIDVIKAAPSVRALCGWLSSSPGSAFACPAPSTLLGLGPGLTPSGDDFLGGVLIALIRIGREDLAHRLYRQIQPDLAQRTGPVSRALIAAAASGEGLESLHAALDAVLMGESESMGKKLAGIDRIGHCSGWDALAGAVTVLRCTPGFESEPQAALG